MGTSFNPRAPCGARRPRIVLTPPPIGFQSTRPMQGAIGCRSPPHRRCYVSIHAPHAGRDTCRSFFLKHLDGFNPRAPCGARLGAFCKRSRQRRFQSTRPMRGATMIPFHVSHGDEFQSTRPMRGATARIAGWSARRHRFNPRAPCGARQDIPRYVWACLMFQSTRPMRGATMIGEIEAHWEEFQSTRPMRGATHLCVQPARRVNVSIHAPHAGRDLPALIPRRACS